MRTFAAFLLALACALPVRAATTAPEEPRFEGGACDTTSSVLVLGLASVAVTLGTVVAASPTRGLFGSKAGAIGFGIAAGTLVAPLATLPLGDWLAGGEPARSFGNRWAWSAGLRLGIFGTGALLEILLRGRLDASLVLATPVSLGAGAILDAVFSRLTIAPRSAASEPPETPLLAGASAGAFLSLFQSNGLRFGADAVVEAGHLRPNGRWSGARVHVAVLGLPVEGGPGRFGIASVDVAWMWRTRLERDRAADPYAALWAGPGLNLQCLGGDFCGGLGVMAGAELGVAFPLASGAVTMSTSLSGGLTLPIPLLPVPAIALGYRP